MPTDTLEKELYYKYDKVIVLTLSNLTASAQPNKKIQLLGFTRKNMEHLFVLRVALMARDIFGVPVEIDASWRDIIYINWKIRKNFGKIKRIARMNQDGTPIDTVLNYIHDYTKENLDANFNFGNIYHAYYEGSLN